MRVQPIIVHVKHKINQTSFFALLEFTMPTDRHEKDQTIPTKTEKAVSSLISRNVTVCGHRTSVRLEPDMWTALKDICKRERASLHEICSAVAAHKSADSSLTASIRVFIMAYFRAAATDEGHMRAGHGSGMPFTVVPKPPMSPALVPGSAHFSTPDARSQAWPHATTPPASSSFLRSTANGGRF